MDACLSSKKHDWGTPYDLFHKLNEEFGFTLDPCASRHNTKCFKYYDVINNGLSKDWSGETVFVNPPFGNQIKKWVKKSYEEFQKGATVVMLIPARTDTRWWHEYCLKAEIRFIKGRLKFEGAKHNAPFPSAIVIFRGKND